MNIYLDIDGVLLANDHHPANHSKEFLEYVLTNFPDSTYWLTTHCQGDATRPVRDIGHLFDNESVELMKLIKPTSWQYSSSKTAAIDFYKPFLWFDDDLFINERKELIEHNALDNWIEVDLRKDPDMLLKFIQSFPLPAEYLDKE
ncbi:hypothetical protein AUK57_00750 [Candidatus Saccharibacteria bacterium CG2_30_41_52]|nr:MAG: hypothetical protein AUK57_00750 [Candidatus Saccharibacteria bacterium CG2_30_41_52]